MLKKTTSKTLGLSLILLLLIQLITPSFAYADNPTTIVVGGSAGKTGAIFKSDGIGAQGPWYPGYSASSVLRVENKYGKKITLNAIGMNITLSRKGEELSFKHKDAKDYMEKMKIKVDYKNPLDSLLKDTIYDGDFDSFRNGAACSIAISNNHSIDLVYTIKMDESAEINVAGIEGKVDFTVNVKELDNGNDEPDKPSKPDKRNRQERMEEEPMEVIPDIAGHWAHDCMITLLEHGIIKGYPDGSLRPDRPITRAESAVLIGRALKLEEKKKFFSGYIDWIPGWAKGYIIATSEKGIFKGYPLKRFKANKNISRQEMVTVLIRGFEKESSDIELTFTDKDKIGDWALEYVKAGVDHEILVGYPDGSFKPLNDITRAEAFVIICKLLGLHEEHEGKNE